MQNKEIIHCSWLKLSVSLFRTFNVPDQVQVWHIHHICTLAILYLKASGKLFSILLSTFGPIQGLDMVQRSKIILLLQLILYFHLQYIHYTSTVMCFNICGHGLGKAHSHAQRKLKCFSESAVEGLVSGPFDLRALTLSTDWNAECAQGLSGRSEQKYHFKKCKRLRCWGSAGSGSVEPIKCNPRSPVWVLT